MTNLLEERKREVIWYLKTIVSTDEAEAMASAGYRPSACGACGRKGCPSCDTDPKESVRAGAHGKAYNTDPRHVRVVIQRMGVFSHKVAAGVMPALEALPVNQRMVISLEYRAGVALDHIAQIMRTSRSTVERWREQGLDTIVAAVWDEVAVGVSS